MYTLLHLLGCRQCEKMSKSSVEEAQIKLKALMEKAQKEKLDLRQLKAIKKRGIAEFKLQRKYKISLIVLLVAVVYGNVQHLFNTDKVSS